MMRSLEKAYRSLSLGKVRYRFVLHALLVLLMVVPPSAGLLLFGHLHRRLITEEFFAQIGTVGEGLLDEVNVYSENLIARTVDLASDEEIVAAFETGARLPLERRLAEIDRLADLDVIEAGDAAGIVLARGHNPGTYGESKADQEIIRRALEGETAADIETGHSGIGLRAVTPVRSRNGAILGTLMAGIRLNQSLLEKIHLVTGFEMALYQDTALVARTRGGLGGGIPWAPPRSIGDRADPERVVFEMNGREQWGLFVPVRHRAGTPFGGLLLWRDAEEILRPLAVYRPALLLAIVTGLVLATAVAFLLGRGLTRPLSNVLESMDEVAISGRLDVAMPDSAWAEFQELSDHFGGMLGEIKRARERTEEARRRLVVAGQFAVLGQVTAELAHEIRNPLNSIEINLRLIKDLLSEEPVDAEAAERKVETIRKEIKRLSRTVREFVEAGGNLKIERKERDLGELVREVVEVCRPQMDSLGILSETRIPGPAPVLMDRNRIHQVLLNLILNACQSMAPGGALTLEAASADDVVTVTVRDTGRGMTEEEKEKLFGFTFSTRAEGTGTGMAYVLRVLEAHGATLNVESEPGRGTTVRIVFPRGSEAE